MPPDIPLIPVLGNRDVSATKRMPEAQREADREIFAAFYDEGDYDNVVGFPAQRFLKEKEVFLNEHGI